MQQHLLPWHGESPHLPRTLSWSQDPYHHTSGSKATLVTYNWLDDYSPRLLQLLSFPNLSAEYQPRVPGNDYHLPSFWGSVSFALNLNILFRLFFGVTKYQLWIRVWKFHWTFLYSVDVRSIPTHSTVSTNPLLQGYSHPALLRIHPPKGTLISPPNTTHAKMPLIPTIFPLLRSPLPSTASTKAW
jgi:hypothetical protein